MMKSHFVYLSLVFALAISSCSSGTGQPSMATPTTPPDEYPSFSTAVPTNSAIIPVTWAHLNLTGKLVYSAGAVDGDNNYIVRIQMLDLVTGVITSIYTAPLNAWIHYVSVSPNSKQLVMSYSPPPGENPDIAQALYTMPLDSSEPPQLLFMPPTAEDQYIQAEWSPDGRYIYYTHVNYRIPEDPNRVSPLYQIFRMAYPNGQPESIAEEAYWPRLSSDSSRLVYISADPLSVERQLMIADADGGNVQEVMLSGAYIPETKEAPLFSPDGQSIIFSGEVAGESYHPNWFEKLMGIQVAKANGGPSEWWSAPVSGGDITQLTNIRHSGLYASISPDNPARPIPPSRSERDNQYIVSSSRDNIFVMKPDGSELTVLIPELRGFTGTVSWIP